MSYITISNSVGFGGNNSSSDVLAVQIILNHFIRNKWMESISKKLSTDGKCGDKTKEAIKVFQYSYARDDFTSGKVTPSGATIKAMNKHAGAATSGGPKPTTPKSPAKPGKPSSELPANLVDRRAEMLRRLIEEGGLTHPKAKLLTDLMMAANVGRHGLVFVQIFGLCAGTAVVAASTAVASILFVIGAIINLDRALSSGYRVAKSLGYAYGYTAWIFNERKPGFSKTLRRKINNSADKHNMPKYEKAWKEGVDKGYREAPLGARKLKYEGKSIDTETYRVYMRYFCQDMSGNLSITVIREIARKTSNKQVKNVLKNHIKGNDITMYPY